MAGRRLRRRNTVSVSRLSMAGQWLSMAVNGCQWLVIAGQWLVSEIRIEKLFLFMSDHYITISDVLYIFVCQGKQKCLKMTIIKFYRFRINNQTNNNCTKPPYPRKIALI